MPNYDVFISFSTADRKTVEGICGYLERYGYRCFVSYRDIPPAVSWPSFISSAIKDSSLMVAVFSKDFNVSKETERELTIASKNNIPILTFKLSDTEMSGSKEYFLTNLNWIDAFPNPENYFGKLKESIEKLIGKPQREYLADKEIHKRQEVKKKQQEGEELDRLRSALLGGQVVKIKTPQPPVPKRREWVKRYIWVIAILLLLVALAVMLIKGGNPTPEPVVPVDTLQHSLVEPSQDEQVITVLPEQEAHTRIVSQSMEPALPSVQAEQEPQAKIATQKVETGQPSIQTEQVSQTKDVTQKEEPEQSTAITKQGQEKPEQQSSSKVRIGHENGNLFLRFKVNDVEFKMVKVEGGTFEMGATREQGNDTYDDEKPMHKVTLSDYYIGETVVTQNLWKAVMGNNPSRFTGDGNLPVERVSWDDAQEFIAKLNRLTGKVFRLPTEAEWEYAARGGRKCKGYKYSGSNNIDEVAWYYYNSGGKTHSVKGKKANELGLYDMSGNVWEWCNDRYGNYSGDAQNNPQGPITGSYRVYRGGCWNNNAKGCHVSNRYSYSPSYRYGNLGFRVVLAE